MNNYDNSTIRRQERLLDEQTALALLESSEYGVLSMIECQGGQQAAYGIPINYVWDGDKYIYIHCAPEGHKLQAVDANPLVSFTIVGQTHVVSHKFTTAYQSVVIRAVAERGLSPEERMAGLLLFLKKYSPNDMEIGMKYTEKSFHRTEILRLIITSISGKAKQVTP